MATYTRAQLRNAVMQELAILDANASPTAEDSVLVLAKIQQVLEGLADASEALIPFDLDADTIPGPYMIPLTRIVAPTVALAFGLADKMNMLLALEATGMRQLRRLKSRPYFGAVATANYF